MLKRRKLDTAYSVVVFVVKAFTGGVVFTDVPDKETARGSVPNDCKDCVLGDSLSPKSLWVRGWHVSVVVVTMKEKKIK